MKKIVICGGHFTPALALIEELEKDKDIKIVFFGRKYSTEDTKNVSVEYTQIQNKKIKFKRIITGRLQRKFTRYTIPSLLKIPLGFVQSFLYLLLERPSIVISFGGYLSTPPVVAAWLIGIPTVTHEQSTKPGLATKINAIFTRTVFLSWQETLKYFGQNAKVIGNPLRSVVFKKTAEDKKISAFIKNSKNLIYITGGNLGSHYINKVVFSSKNLLKNYSVIHQVGSLNHRDDWQNSQKIKSPNYLPVNFVTGKNIGMVLNSADIIIARSGANTVYEAAALAKAAVFVPIPNSSSNEQFENAKILKDNGSAQIIEQKDFTEEKLLEVLSSMFANFKMYQTKAQHFSKQIKKDAAAVLRNEILKIINEN